MYVKKFEGETLDDALKQVKKEMGSDAIILKTVTHKGLGGVLKKKIEVTAAMTKNESRKSENENTYGKISLNRPVKSLKTAESVNENKSSQYLDELKNFLGDRSESTNQIESDETELRNNLGKRSATKTSVESLSSYDTDELNYLRKKNDKLESAIQAQSLEFRDLQEKYLKLETLIGIQSQDEQKQSALGRLRTTFKTLDIDESVIRQVIERAQRDLTQDQLANDDYICDYALDILQKFINTKEYQESQVTLLISDGACGQTSLAYKMASQSKHKVSIIKLTSSKVVSGDLVNDFFDYDMVVVSDIQSCLLACQEKIKAGFYIVLDLDATGFNGEDIQTLLNSLNRFYESVQCILVLSAIHSQLYNRNIMSKYYKYTHAVAITHMDRCLSVGEVLNCHYAYRKIPMTLVCDGPTIPRDIRQASSEYIIEKLLN